ncbi:hypothetical protein HBB16_09585, partial [Pseudonocardia sp. MCCB 268]|nr:hypothetical protein [Pseudonocardia cytotoxica]
MAIGLLLGFVRGSRRRGQWRGRPTPGLPASSARPLVPTPPSWSGFQVLSIPFVVVCLTLAMQW